LPQRVIDNVWEALQNLSFEGKLTSRINNGGAVQFYFKAEHHLMNVLEHSPKHCNYWMVGDILGVIDKVRITETTADADSEVYHQQRFEEGESDVSMPFQQLHGSGTTRKDIGSRQCRSLVPDYSMENLHESPIHPLGTVVPDPTPVIVSAAPQSEPQRYENVDRDDTMAETVESNAQLKEPIQPPVSVGADFQFLAPLVSLFTGSPPQEDIDATRGTKHKALQLDTDDEASTNRQKNDSKDKANLMTYARMQRKQAVLSDHNQALRFFIDFAMVNMLWTDLFPSAYAQLLHWMGSDHRPLMVYIDSKAWKAKKFFKYDNRWTHDPQMQAVVSTVWEEKCERLPPQHFGKAIIHCCDALARWKRVNNTNTSKQIQALQQSLHHRTAQDYFTHLYATQYPSSDPELLAGTSIWNEEKLHHLFAPPDVQTILKIRPSITNVSDSLSWLHTRHRLYTVESGYAILLPVASQFCKCGIHIGDTCLLCGQEEEMLNHLLFRCNISHEGTMTRQAPSHDASSIPQFCRNGSSHCCFVAASWTAPNTAAGIAWYLYTKDVNLVLQGSSSIRSLPTQVEDEGIALKMAIQEIPKLRYENVVFLRACSQLYILLSQGCEALTAVPLLRSISMDVQDIVRLATHPYHTF
ncbi:unnamed protein product, partial [Thlaspi arvense]